MLPLSNLFKSSYGRSSLINYVSLRWRSRPRKPFWLGLAKTKLFVIPEKKKLPPDEEEELKRLNYIYDRQLKSLKNSMLKMYIQQKDQLEEINRFIEEGKLVHEKWNEETARLREERLKREEIEKEEIIIKKIERRGEQKKKLADKIEEIFRKEVEASATYITEESVDEVIDKCLESVSDYNYAMDLSGNIYKGESQVPVGKINEVQESSDINELVKQSSSEKEIKEVIKL